MNSTSGGILVCIGPAEKCHRAIAEIAGDLTSIAPDRRAALPPIRVNEFLEILRIQLFRKPRRSNQITEHDCDLTEFSFAMLHSAGGLARCRQCFNGPEQLLAVT